jgi:hypothetical protein
MAVIRDATDRYGDRLPTTRMRKSASVSSTTKESESIMSAPWKQKATKAGGGEFEIPEAGSHPAVCIGLIDLGTHTETFKDKQKGTERKVDLRKVLIVWELTDQPMTGMKNVNHVIGRDFNVTFSDKSALRKMVEAWGGKKFKEDEEFDLSKLLGKPGMVTVSHGEGKTSGKAYAKFEAIAPVPKNMTVPPAQRKPVQWSVTDDDALLPDWLPYIYGEPAVDWITRCHEVKGNLRETADTSADAPAGNEGPF